MGLETGTYINSLNSANPTGTDPKSAGDDHIRLLKSTIKATFPNISAAVTPTAAELNHVAGVTSAIQTQLNTLSSGKQDADPLLAALAAQTTAAAKIQGYSGVDTVMLYDFKDEDDMASNSASALPSQQSVKAYADTKNIATQVAPGASGNVLTSNGSGWVSQAPTGIFTQSYTSADQTITAGGTLTLAHGLGVAPKMVQFFIVAQNAVAGYAVGDEVEINFNPVNLATNVGYTYTKDATNINVKFGSNSVTLNTLNFSTGAATALTNSDWKLRVKAYA